MKKLIQLYNRIPSYIKNKYTLTLFGFFIWMLFFDAHNIINRVQSYLELNDARIKREYYKSEISQAKKDMQDLLTNQSSLERFAREKYMMKKEDEDLFIIVEK